MSSRPPAVPVRYEPVFERPEPDEAETTRALVETMRKIQEKTFEDGGHALRSVHAKSHALLQGELEVLVGLPPHLAQGLAAKPGRYPVVMRLSTIPGDILDDNVSTPRGLAIKVVGVQGERLHGSEGHNTQDFVLVNAPAFLKSDAKSFLKSLKLLAATTDKAPGLKKVLSSVLQGVEKVIESAGGQSPTIMSMGGHPETHPLGETYYSQVPVLWGEYMAKVAVAPIAPELTVLTKKAVDIDGMPNGLREAVAEHFARRGGTWELRVQLCTNLEEMPIEDAKVVWPEERSPYVAVARIRVAAQPSWTAARADAVDDRMSFSPWHGLAAHRPIGSVMRVRKAAYEAARAFRESRNQQPVDEPRVLENLPG
ncbi:MAG: catalase family protein [Methylibium sp.]|uniref:catalase family protein n=1 Tax=Methylibium sp. TaxID=2067992 RepID=UPI0017D87E24|nr:catalase family protein [Methylibium sp.]MBA3597542.1 catalase family protein [Methylibium sp.]